MCTIEQRQLHIENENVNMQMKTCDFINSGMRELFITSAVPELPESAPNDAELFKQIQIHIQIQIQNIFSQQRRPIQVP